MNNPGRFSRRPLFMLVLAMSAATLLFAGGRNAPTTPRDEVDIAYGKLSTTPHRKRETVLGPMAAMGGVKPVVTDVVGNRTRLVYEVDLPRYGRMRAERVTVGSRAAVRTAAPEIVAMIEKSKSKATVQSVRSLVNQIVSVAAAMQTGGLSTSAAIQQAVSAAATMKSTADARRVLDQAAKAFNAWQLVSVDEVDDFATFHPSTFAMEVTSVGVMDTKQGIARKYVRRPAGESHPMPDVVETILVDVGTGLPVAEEMTMDGQPVMRVEYFDLGAHITIDAPECLR